MCTTSVLSILIHGVRSLPDAVSHDENTMHNFSNPLISDLKYIKKHAVFAMGLSCNI